jgi:hypothetical protein
MHLAGFEPAIPKIERPQTHALVGASTVTGRIISDKANYEDMYV